MEQISRKLGCLKQPPFYLLTLLHVSVGPGFSLAVLERHLGSLWICRCLETLVLLDLMRLEKCLVVSTGSE